MLCPKYPRFYLQIAFSVIGCAFLIAQSTREECYIEILLFPYALELIALMLVITNDNEFSMNSIIESLKALLIAEKVNLGDQQLISNPQRSAQ